ncbi:UNVERIFIED_CONTAM: hypothetical protein Sradi_2318200 [Sesamum radiatum]|uniref:Uncharacterized protein n=1 Tax=Sesamum radiatum TaxID=300843 RepID=A0AAW2T4S7_SESRA
MGTFLMCGDAIRQVLSHSEDVFPGRYKDDCEAPPCARAGNKYVEQSALMFEFGKLFQWRGSWGIGHTSKKFQSKTVPFE